MKDGREQHDRRTRKMYILRCDAGRKGLGPVPLSRMWDDYKQMHSVQEAEQQL